jgi:hypothetical protein
VTLSVPGEVLETPIVLRSTSSSRDCLAPSQVAGPVPFRKWIRIEVIVRRKTFQDFCPQNLGFLHSVLHHSAIDFKRGGFTSHPSAGEEGRYNVLYIAWSQLELLDGAHSRSG